MRPRFMAAIEDEAEGLAAGWTPAAGRESIRDGLLRQGHYAEELASGSTAFDREQILLVRSEDLFADPTTTYGVVCRHLGLPDATPPSFGWPTPAGRRICPPRPAGWLDDHFAEPNARLAELTGGAICWP